MQRNIFGIFRLSSNWYLYLKSDERNIMIYYDPLYWKNVGIYWLRHICPLIFSVKLSILILSLVDLIYSKYHELNFQHLLVSIYIQLWNLKVSSNILLNNLNLEKLLITNWPNTLLRFNIYQTCTQCSKPGPSICFCSLIFHRALSAMSRMKLLTSF